MSDDAAAVEESTEEDEDAAPAGSAPDDAEEGNDVSDAATAQLVDRIVDADPSLEAEATELRSRIDSLTEDVDAKDKEIDELTDKLSRARADFKTYKK